MFTKKCTTTFFSPKELKFWQLQTQFVTNQQFKFQQIKTSNCDKTLTENTQKLKMWQNPNCGKTQNSSCDKTQQLRV